jgi:hypothetical protein
MGGDVEYFLNSMASNVKIDFRRQLLYASTSTGAWRTFTWQTAYCNISAVFSL